MNIIKDGDKWKVDDAELEALLSLVSYSAWAAEQNKRNQEDKQKRESTVHLESSGHRTKEQNVENSRSIGWLRTKVSDSQIYLQVVGKSKPKLLSDLFWWASNTEQVLKKVNLSIRAKELGLSPLP